MAGSCFPSCPVEGGFYVYEPSLGGNAALAAAFGLLAPVVFVLGYKFRTPLFSTTLATGVLFDVVGFVGRILLRTSLDRSSYFFLGLLGTALGPAFEIWAVVLVLPHLLTVYGDHVAPFSPRVAAHLVHSLVVAAILVQVVGIVLLAFSGGGISRTQGAYIVVGGLATQALALVVSACLRVWFTLGMSTARSSPELKYSTVYKSLRFKKFLLGFHASGALFLIHTIYRISEMVDGPRGAMFQNQVKLMVMNGAVPLLACALLTLFQPGAAFGSAWESTSPRRVRHPPPPSLNPHSIVYVHHRYDPNIRSPYSDTSQPSSSRRGSHPPQVSRGSPGLPPNPRPVRMPSVSSPPSGTATNRLTSSSTMSSAKGEKGELHLSLGQHHCDGVPMTQLMDSGAPDTDTTVTEFADRPIIRPKRMVNSEAIWE